ncbi:MAG: rhomboid family intramembrane serine protease [Paracoccaceae bacterium]
MQDHNAPINPLPWVVWLLALPLIAVEVVLGLGQAGIAGGPEAIGWRMQAVQQFAFVPDALWWMVENRRLQPDLLARILCYPVINGSFTSALFAGAMLLALGKMVGEVMRWWAVLAVFFAGAIVAALAFALVARPGFPLFGTFPPIYALIGAFTWLLWQRRRAMGANRVGAFRMIGFLLAIQPIFALMGWILNPQPEVEWYWLWIWIADLAGFATGFGLAILLVPGGWGSLMARMRSR